MKTVLFLLLLMPIASWAQVVHITEQDTQRKQSYLLMRDGSVLRGQVVRQDSALITVRKRNGDLSFVEADQVVRISAVHPDPDALGSTVTSAGTATVFVLRDSSRLEGTYIRRDSTMITVRKKNGQLTYFEPELLVRIDTVRSGLESAGVSAATDRIFTNQFSPWLLTGLTAYTAKKRNFYYRSTLLLLNELDYGITRHWSVGASFVTPVTYLSLVDFYAFNGFLPIRTQLFSKLSLPIGSRFRLALNGQYGEKPGGYNRGPVTFQALASVGTSQRNVTLGYGWTSRGKQQYYLYQPPYSSYSTLRYEVAVPNQSFLTLGMMQKVANGLTLVSDNRINLGQPYYYDDRRERVSLSFALRVDRRRHAFDLGLYSLVYGKEYEVTNHRVRMLPYLGYNLLIGRP